MPEPYIQLSVRLPDKAYRDVRQIAYERKTSVAKWILEAVAEKLERDNPA